MGRFAVIAEEIAARNPEALLADGLEDALVGYTANHHAPVRAVYDAERCRQILIDRDGMTYEEASEFLEFNTFGAYVGENGPVYMEIPPDARP